MSNYEVGLVGRRASIIAAAWPPVFLLLFFVLLPHLGLDLDRLGDPHHVLPFFAKYPAVIRLIGTGNVVMIVAAIVFAVCLARVTRSRGVTAWLAGLLSIVGWLLYLTGELCDLAAYVTLPATYGRDTDVAAMAFVTLQTVGRMMHAFGYGVIGSGLAAFSLVLRRDLGFDSSHRALAAGGGFLGLLLFAIEYFVITRTGDAGGAELTLFAGVLTANVVVLSAFHWFAGAVVARAPRGM